VVWAVRVVAKFTISFHRSPLAGAKFTDISLQITPYREDGKKYFFDALVFNFNMISPNENITHCVAILPWFKEIKFNKQDLESIF